MDRLIGAQEVYGRDAGSRGADIERFGELNELRTRRVCSPQKDWDLDAYARRSA